MIIKCSYATTIIVPSSSIHENTYLSDPEFCWLSEELPLSEPDPDLSDSSPLYKKYAL